RRCRGPPSAPPAARRRSWWAGAERAARRRRCRPRLPTGGRRPPRRWRCPAECCASSSSRLLSSQVAATATGTSVAHSGAQRSPPPGTRRCDEDRLCAQTIPASSTAQERHVSTESSPGTAAPAPIRLRHLKQAKERGRPFSMLTAYDQFSAQAFEAAGIEVLLVGDSVGTTVLGYDSTTSTTHQDMLTFTGAVARSVSRPLVVADLAFGTYEAGPDDALRHGVELVRAG